jgi:DNA polymerase
MSTHANFLQEMGVTEWISRDSPVTSATQTDPVVNQTSAVSRQPIDVIHKEGPEAHWMFFGNELKGEAQLLFQNIVRALGLSRDEWVWKSPHDKLANISSPETGVPVVALAFGGPAAQTITGERDPLPQLRETILALNTGNEEDIPVVATFDLNQLVSKPKDKALLWQDLLLAKSVLQNS